MREDLDQETLEVLNQKITKLPDVITDPDEMWFRQNSRKDSREGIYYIRNREPNPLMKSRKIR